MKKIQSQPEFYHWQQEQPLKSMHQKGSNYFISFIGGVLNVQFYWPAHEVTLKEKVKWLKNGGVGGGS